MTSVPDWAREEARRIVETRGGEHTVATGVSPSGPIHIGNMREVFIADSVARALREAGAKARLIYVADSYDPLRKVYPFLPREYEAHVGRPLSEIPDPQGCCGSYAEHFLRGLDVLRDLDIEDGSGATVAPIRTDQAYKEGRYAEAIRTALDHRDDLARIIREVSTRDVPPDWSPYMPICGKCGRLDRTKVTDHDAASAGYRCACGHAGRASYRGGGKLGWRIDWPARWRLFGVTVEPFGKDIGAAGGSYDTGVRIAREVFGYEPPHPIYFEHILLKGAAGGKLSKSAGLTLTARELLDLMEPDALRHLITRTTPRKSIHFDPGLELQRDLDEYTARQRPGEPTLGHLVTVIQMAPSTPERLQVLRRGGFDTRDTPRLERRLKHAENWLDRHGPPETRFHLQPTLPPQAQSLTPAQKQALRELLPRVGQATAEEWHNGVYEAAQKAGVAPKEAFAALYTILLGTTQGPRAGWFLQSQEPEFLRRRLQEASTP